MARPPRGDPRRPLHLAISSCRVLGILALMGTTCMGLGVTIALSHVRLGPGGRATPFWVALVPTFLTGGVGVAYLVVAAGMKRRRFWAVVTALALTFVLLVLALIGMAGLLIVLVARAPGLGSEPFAWTTLAVYGLIALALGQLIYHLARSFPALTLVPSDEGRGFEVLPVAVLPSEPPAVEGTEGHGNPT